MKKWLASYLSFDKPMLLAMVALLALGVYVIYSGSNFHATELGRPSYYYAMNHLKVIALGFVAMGIVTAIDHKLWHDIARPVFILCLVGLILVIIMGAVTKGAARWLTIAGFSIQPAELMKVAMFAYMARRLSELGDAIVDLKRGMIQPLVTLGIVAVLILLQPNFSMTLMIGVSTFVLLFVAGARLKYLGGALALCGILVLGVGLSASYRLKRLTVFLHPEEHLSGGGYQLYNALVSLGHGGITGTGIGQGTQKLGFLPESYKDVAFSLLGEELGFLGTSFVLILFGLIVYRGFVIAQNAKTRFAKYFATGLTCALGLNVILHVFVNTGLMPTTGQPLPFISYGGTNLLVSMISGGILLNISRPNTGLNIDEPRSIVQTMKVA